jgi:hypothetical protein
MIVPLALDPDHQLVSLYPFLSCLLLIAFVYEAEVLMVGQGLRAAERR